LPTAFHGLRHSTRLSVWPSLPEKIRRSEYLASERPFPIEIKKIIAQPILIVNIQFPKNIRNPTGFLFVFLFSPLNFFHRFFREVSPTPKKNQILPSQDSPDVI
jgi:hypothetical protein